MKNQLHSFSHSIPPTSDQNNPFTSIYCTQKHPSTLACINKKCFKYAFACDQKSCTCKLQHKKCLLVKTETLSASLSSKSISCEPLQNLISTSIDSLIDKLSDFRDRIEEKLKNMELNCLGEAQEEFLRKVKQLEVNEITGKQIWEVSFENKQEDIIEKNFQRNFQYVQNHLKKFQDERQLMCRLIELELKSFETAKETYLFQTSDIIRCRQEDEVIRKFFPQNKNLSNASLIFRASEHNFSVEKFHQICSHVTNTLVLCWTDGDRKIGGYTPLPWLGMQGRYFTDDSFESFIFSLTNKDKFHLRQKNSAVYSYNDTSFAFSFGSGGDFKISNHADKNSNSRTKINTTYINNDYEDDDPGSYERFCGNSSSYFKVKEWEVWKVEFQYKEKEEMENEKVLSKVKKD